MLRKKSSGIEIDFLSKKKLYKKSVDVELSLLYNQGQPQFDKNQKSENIYDKLDFGN